MPSNEKPLVSQKCTACEGGVLPMSKAKAEEYLRQVPNWKLVENAKKIQSEFLFKDFVCAMRFINRVADLAESEGHHPDIFVSWNRVVITTYTHKINGLFSNDFILAAKIDKLER